MSVPQDTAFSSCIYEKSVFEHSLYV